MPKPPIPANWAAIFAKPNPAVVATLNADGRPNTVATWYLWDDGRVLLSMDENRARLNNVRRDPRVSLTALDNEDWYGHISVRGRVVELQPDEGLVQIDRLAQHYTGEPYPVRDRERVSAWVEIDSWHAWAATDMVVAGDGEQPPDPTG